jgi:diguanylate cyclase (GGDEF)-like protein
MANINLDLQASHKMLLLLDEANTHTESIIDQIPGIFLIINDKYEVLRANQEFAAVIGMEQEAMLRLPLSRYFEPQKWKIFARQVKTVVAKGATGGAVRFELDMIAPGAGSPESGKPFHWIVTWLEVRNKAEGRLLSVFGHDMSEMRATERRLVEVFTSIPLGIFTLNSNGRVGSSHSSYLSAMLDRDDLSGQHIDEVLFKPALTRMDENARLGAKAVTACLGKSQLEYERYSGQFPSEVFYQANQENDDGRFFRITYQPIVLNHTVAQLLIILEDRTAVVNAKRDISLAAKERETSLALYESAIHDPLTGLFTRLYMKDAVDALLAEHNAGTLSALSLAIFDIDHFKKVNDSHGHKNGDLVLKQVAQVVLEQAAADDIPIRFGGEEFVVFLPSGVSVARELAERVRLAVQTLRIGLDATVISVTISGGTVGHKLGETLDDFMHRADTLLYEAKHNGRNQNVSESD